MNREIIALSIRVSCRSKRLNDYPFATQKTKQDKAKQFVSGGARMHV